ncbi:ead/Ea22-like family protein [Escherichia coli]|uniref:ead/Ea22-like family protein n=1 Tax=Escherichia coli TaxID=562 RepID=UPI001C289282|nr:ead/Ea22-like family protein [Escherichia coli]MDF9037914.1 ead/Ea22-like family protein [Escherichia coli]HBH4437339.1 ead/Ea22-like family protein [Escherichia coli]
MSEINYQALREVAEAAKGDTTWQNLQAFRAAATPEVVQALLDENERMCRDLITRNGEIEVLRKWAEELEAREVALPVASCIVEDGEMCIDGFGEYVGHSLPDGRHELYAAPPVSAVPAALERLRAIVADPRALPRRKEWVSGQQYSYVLLENVEAMVDEACRAAMLQGKGGA